MYNKNRWEKHFTYQNFFGFNEKKSLVSSCCKWQKSSGENHMKRSTWYTSSTASSIRKKQWDYTGHSSLLQCAICWVPYGNPITPMKSRAGVKDFFTRNGHTLICFSINWITAVDAMKTNSCRFCETHKFSWFTGICKNRENKH